MRASFTTLPASILKENWVYIPVVVYWQPLSGVPIHVCVDE